MVDWEFYIVVGCADSVQGGGISSSSVTVTVAMRIPGILVWGMEHYIFCVTGDVVLGVEGAVDGLRVSCIQLHLGCELRRFV